MIERKGYYHILDGKTPVPVGNIIQWGQRKQTEPTVEDIEISTVFLGLVHGYLEGQPLLFETMIFGGDIDADDFFCPFRSSTWEKAERAHDVVVDRLRERQKKIK